MSEKSVADLVEEWQTGSFLIVASGVAALVVGVALHSLGVPFGAAIGGVGGAVVAFLLLSFLLYGR
jgi:membrane protein implicated in regulation of membrane protease activity